VPGPYLGDPFDFVAAYLIPEDLWYIIPEEMIRGQGSIAGASAAEDVEVWAVSGAWHLLGLLIESWRRRCHFSLKSVFPDRVSPSWKTAIPLTQLWLRLL
jgi:hypothetical protein